MFLSSLLLVNRISFNPRQANINQSLLYNMSKDFINEIEEFKRNNVHIKDKEHVNNVINELVKGGINRLQVVSDFDQTITKQHENGKRHMSSFRMFNSCPSIPQSYLDVTTELTNKYFPIELNPAMSVDEKRKHMEDWWYQSEQALVGLKVSPKEIDEVVAKLAPTLRDGSTELFNDLYDKKIPTLVFSAGLGDTVQATLKHFNVFHSNVKVVSNFLKYDESGAIVGFQGGRIHIFNKNEYALKGTEYYDTILDRDNIILMGDSLGDAQMAEGISHSNHVLKIGFLYEHVEENLPVYKDIFDIVLEDDQSMDIIRALLKNIS